MKNKLFLIIFVYLVLCTSTHLYARDLTSFEKISSALKNKKITQDKAILYKYYSVVSPQKLPKEYRSSQIIKSGTILLKQIRQEIENLPEKYKKLLPLNIQKYQLPPPSAYCLDKILDTQNFRIHYTTTKTPCNNDGLDQSVSTADANKNSIPDYVENAAEYLEYSYKKIVKDLGYLPPPKSNPASHYKVYLYNTNRQFYGWTDFDRGDVLIAIDSKLNFVANNEDPEGKIKGALKVTAVHELFHAVKAAYNWNVDAPFWWFDEATSTWIEEVVFPEVNDYIRYLNYWFSNPERPLDSGYGLHAYGSCIFAFYLSEKLGIDVIKAIWERLKDTQSPVSLPQIKIELETRGILFSNFFTNFTIANYTKDYIEGAKYPNIKILSSYNVSNNVTITSQNLYHLSSNYLEYIPQGASNLLLNFDGEDTITGINTLAVSLIKKKKTGAYETQNLQLSIPSQQTHISSQQTQVDIANFTQNYDKIIVVINNLTFGDAFAYNICTGVTVDFSLETPSNIRLEKTDSGIRILWDSVSDVDGYKIYRGTNKDTLSLLTSLGLVNSYEDKNIIPGVNYYYAVTCVSEKKESFIKTSVRLLQSENVYANVYNYPNPCKLQTTFNISATLQEEPYKITLSIYNLAGYEIISKSYFPGGTNYSEYYFGIVNNDIKFLFSPSFFSNGAYIYIIKIYLPSRSSPVFAKGKLVVLR